MRYGHLPSGSGGHYIICSEDGATWASLGIAFGDETATLIVEALTEHAAVHELRGQLEEQPEL